MSGSSFNTRVALLLGLMLAVSMIDWYRNRAGATRFREYGFMLVTGIVGATIGGINDTVTSSISREFFILGKGLDDNPQLTVQSALYGMRAGFAAGIIGGAICLFATRRRAAAGFGTLFRLLWIPVAAAILGGLIFQFAFSGFDPVHLRSQLAGLTDNDGAARFLRVWWTHVGLYGGLMIGLAVMIVRARRAQWSDLNNLK